MNSQALRETICKKQNRLINRLSHSLLSKCGSLTYRGHSHDKAENKG